MLIPIIAILALLPLASPQCLSNYQYADPNTGSCLPCPYNCKSCFNQLFCMQCTPQHYLSNAQCLPCSFGCSVCQDPSTCTTCNDGLYLTASGGCSPCATGVATCSIATIQTCTSGYFLLGSICAGCLSNCKTCSDFVTCSACMLGYYLEPTGTSCSPCPSNCRVCSGSTSCSECQQGYTQNATGCTAYSCQSIDPLLRQLRQWQLPQLSDWEVLVWGELQAGRQFAVPVVDGALLHRVLHQWVWVPGLLGGAAGQQQQPDAGVLAQEGHQVGRVPVHPTVDF